MAKRIKRKKLPPIQLEKELLLSVDGHEEKKHTLSWEILKKIGDNTQTLISKLAKYSVEENALTSVKLIFTGFLPGSAIPRWKVEETIELFPTKAAYNILNQDFGFVISCLDDGNFQAIADRYNEPSVKNEIVDAVYNFSNSAGTKPFCVVKGTVERGFKPLAKLRRISIAQKNILIVSESKDKADFKTEEVEGVGKVLLKISNTGRKTKKVSELYTQKEAVLSLKFDSIEVNDRIYVLRNEIFFSFSEDKKQHHVTIENPALDIYAYGANMKEAEQDMYEQFDYTYRRLNDIQDEKLSNHLLSAKRYINLLVETIKPA